MTFSHCCFAVGMHNERSGCLALGLRQHLSENVRPATKNYWAERGRSISFLEALKLILYYVFHHQCTNYLAKEIN